MADADLVKKRDRNRTWTRPTPWWERDEYDDGLAREVSQVASNLKDHQSVIFERYRSAINRYEGLQLVDLDPRTYLDAQEGLTRFGLARSVCDTVHAELVGRPRPRPRIMTTGADWQTQRAAKRLEKAVTGQLLLRQGNYSDAYAVRDMAVRDSEVVGVGYLKVFPGTDRVHVERVLPWQLLVDPVEAQYGDPSTFCLVDVCDKDYLLDRYVYSDDELEDEERALRANAIETATDSHLVPGTSATHGRISRMVEVLELHRVSLGPDCPGRIVVVCNNVVLSDREWKRTGSQFVRYCWNPHIQGWGGSGIIQQVAGIDSVLDECLRRTCENFVIRNGRRTYYEEGSINTEDLEKNDAEVFVSVTPAATKMPVESVVSPLQPGELEFIQFLKAIGYELTGVSQMAATSRKEPGITAAKAIRSMQDIFTKRFAPQGKLLDASDVDLFSKVIWAIQDAAEANGGKMSLRWRGQDFLRDLDFRDCDVDEEIYDVTLASESEVASSVAGRISTLEEGLGTGLISPLTFRRLTEGTLDTESAGEVEREQYGYLEDMIDQMLDAKEGDEFQYEAPEGLLPDKAGAIAQLTAAYFSAKRRRAPEYNLTMLRNYIDSLDKMIAAAMAAQIAAQNAAKQNPSAVAPSGQEGAPLGAPGVLPMPQAA